jgi:hypothetical protein
MGKARAPVAASGICPAWMARVSGWNWRSVMVFGIKKSVQKWQNNMSAMGRDACLFW